MSTSRPPPTAEPVLEDDLEADLKHIGIDSNLGRRRAHGAGGATNSNGGTVFSEILMHFHLLASYRYFTCAQVLGIMDKVCMRLPPSAFAPPHARDTHTLLTALTPRACSSLG